MRYLALLLILNSYAYALDLTVHVSDNVAVLNPLPNASWHGTVTWRFDPSFPAGRRKPFRAAMKAHPEFQESPCGVVVYNWKQERQTAWGLLPKSYAFIVYIGWASDTGDTWIDAGVTIDATTLRRVKNLRPVADTIALKILYPNGVR